MERTVIMLAGTTALGIQREVADGSLGTSIEDFAAIVSRNLPSFYRRALRQLGNVQDAEDAVQDALLSSYTHLSQFKGKAQLSTWLTTIVINAAKMQVRRRRIGVASLDQKLGEAEGVSLWEVFADNRPSPEETCIKTELRDRVLEIVPRLSPPLRRAFQFCDLDGLTTRETAKILGIAEGTVKAQLARARAKLARRLRKALGLSRSKTQAYSQCKKASYLPEVSGCWGQEAQVAS
jgi:RNA polymerase sigma-70 factor (ECF subfamily)